MLYWCYANVIVVSCCFGAHWQAHIRKVRSLFTNLDADDSGYISLKELEQNIDKKSATGWKCWDIWGDIIWDILRKVNIVEKLSWDTKFERKWFSRV